MKKIIIILTTILLSSTSSFANTQQIQFSQAQTKLEALEKNFDGKIGVYAINTNNNQTIGYRADERFPVQSTMKLIGVAALLKQSQDNNNLLQEKIHYSKNDLAPWHPITGKYVNRFQKGRSTT